MGEADATSQDFALYPLTLCDNMSIGANMAKAWIVEGILDVEKIRAALDKVVAKWPLLAGRIVVAGKKRYQIRIPLGPLPEGYKAYGLTSESSPLPLSHYIKLPLLPCAEFPPARFFVEEQRLKLGIWSEYQKKDEPITHWHITRFEHEGEEYSCIGVHYSHGLFDGVGFSVIMHAVEAELAGKEWQVPPLPKPGLNENRFTTLMEEEIEKADQTPSKDSEPYLNFIVLGLWGILHYIFSNLLEKWRYGVGDFNLIVPYAVHTKLVVETRKEMEAAGIADVRITSGDVVTAWMMKAIYTDGTNPKRIVGLNNMASLRSEWNGELALYPHNCIAALPYPTFSVGDVNTLPLYEITRRLAKARSGSRIADAVGAFRHFKEADRRKIAVALPQHHHADENLMSSNVSIARVADLDWKGAGGGRVLCHYKYFTNQPIKVVNVLGINGRLDNGDLVLNCALNNKRGKCIENELNRLIELYED